eukprot:NODE_703_length_2439_cov_71.008636_g604_i0.p1 GENE.NODE_703_length_2439_cov_71.008636_g604_i0~~NODE_703_length_2439_cov_71.008636_g604_i0.p1  ORF type:complete len:367 (+),score=40.24 NODE_703_length_2439_cov_71.008636_g604_i0:5-1105(+)
MCSFTEDTVPVKDPTHGGKLWLPSRGIVETNGTLRYREIITGNSNLREPSLCILFQEGKCKAGSNCNQIHADPEVVQSLRARTRTCCLAHGHRPSNEESFKSAFLSRDDPLQMCTTQGTFNIPRCWVARTKYLEEVLEREQDQRQKKKRGYVWFPMNRVCRLHQNKKCTFGTECSHIHICRTFWSKMLEQHPELIGEPDPSMRRKKKQDSDEESSKRSSSSGSSGSPGPTITSSPLSPDVFILSPEAWSSPPTPISIKSIPITPLRSSSTSKNTNHIINYTNPNCSNSHVITIAREPNVHPNNTNIALTNFANAFSSNNVDGRRESCIARDPLQELIQVVTQMNLSNSAHRGLYLQFDAREMAQGA